MLESKPRVLIVGGSGYLGRHLLALLRKQGLEVWATFLRNPVSMESNARFLDIRDSAQVSRLLTELEPQVIFHLAYDMQDLEGSVVQGTRNLLAAWETLGGGRRFFYLSTDMVFDGENPPYGEEDSPRPITSYGRAKLKAEAMALQAGAHVLRTSLVYGLNPPDPRTQSLMKGFRTGAFDYPYFEDEIRSAVFIEELCAAMAQMVLTHSPLPPVLHIAGSHSVSRYFLACLLARAMCLDPQQVPRARLRESPTPRPKDLTLKVSLASKLLGWSPRSAQELLGESLGIWKSGCREV